MAKQPNQSQSGMNVQAAQQKNVQSAGQFGTEFASETNVQEVKKQVQQAEANKAKNSGSFGQ